MTDIESRYQNLFKTTRECVFIIEKETLRIVDANPEACRLYGYSREELLEMRSVDISAEPDKSEAAVTNGSVEVPIRYHRKKDGTVFPVEISGGYFDMDGISYHTAAIRDITDRKQAEVLLRESEETFRSLFEKGPIGVAYHRVVYDQSGNAVDYRFLNANESFKRLTQVDPVGKLVTEVFPGIEEDPFDWIGTYAQVAKTGHEIRFQQHFQHNDRWYECVCYQNKPDHFVVAFVDVTRQKLAELKLVETNARHIAMIGNMGDVIGVMGVDGIMKYKSPNIEKWFGWKPEDLVGTQGWETVHPEDIERLQKEFSVLLENDNASTTVEYRYRCKDGSYTWIELAAVNRINDKLIDGVLLNYHDITARKQAEAREQELRQMLDRAARMESLGVLAGGVAHDLNNILGPLLLLPELIKEYVEEYTDSTNVEYADTIESLETIARSTQRAASVVSDLVVMGRRGQFQTAPVNVDSLVDQLLESKQIEVLRTARCDVDISKRQGNEAVWCMGSESRLLRVLANLVGNAVDAIEGQGDVIIATGRRVITEPFHGFDVVPPGDYVAIDVTDTGCGMDTKTMLRSFEPFFSTKATSDRSGSGLGLSVVHGLVKDHEGFLDLRSEPGEGTKFTIYLPAIEEEAPSEASRAEPAPRGNERILVVDDEVGQQVLARRLLKKFGYDATVVSSGEEAVAQFESAKREGKPSPFDLVLMDMIMSGMDGVVTSKEIRRMYSRQKVLIMSGHAPGNLDDEAEALGISWLAKPYTPDGLAKALRASL